MGPENKFSHLLQALPIKDRQQLIGCAEHVPMQLGKVLHNAGGRQTKVWFPVDGIISLLYELTDGDTAEVAIIGHDGMLGLPVLMGNGSSPHVAVVQVEGSALRMDAGKLVELFDSNPTIRQMLLCYAQAITIQIGQTAVCNRHHRVEQQFCRWVLMSIDRLPGDALSMTQELIANMLGVRRAGVTEVAGRLREQGLIDYQRGEIRVLDRAKLEARCCECYQVVKNEYARLLPPEVVDEQK